MAVRILQQAPEAATGLAVIIDVFRAFSTACYLIERGVQRIYPADDLKAALARHARHPDALLVGERRGRKPPGFDYGNSPTAVMALDTVPTEAILTTSAGTRGLMRARQASRVITGSLVNAEAIVRYIQARATNDISLVCMGHRTLRSTDEDTACAEYLAARLRGKTPDTGELVQRLRGSPDARRFFDPAQTESPESDFTRCTDCNRCDFVLSLTAIDGIPCLVPECPD